MRQEVQITLCLFFDVVLNFGPMYCFRRELKGGFCVVYGSWQHHKKLTATKRFSNTYTLKCELGYYDCAVKSHPKGHFPDILIHPLMDLEESYNIPMWS